MIVRYPPVPPLCHAIDLPLAVPMCQPRAISVFGAPAGFLGCSIALMAGFKGDSVYSMNAARNVNMSLADDRSAPAPASVGMSQFLVGFNDGSCPVASLARISGVSVMLVLVMPSGPVIRVFTSDS